MELSEVAPAPALARSRVTAYWELTKPRIAGMVLVATALGFYLALPADADLAALSLFVHALWGTALVGGGANALNQCLEAGPDARMVRTAGRPLPSGCLSGSEALTFALSASIMGIAHLCLFVNLLTGALAMLALVSYALVYTPLKRRTSLCVFVGALPGALPPVIGWSAVAGSVEAGAWLLFAILFLWQLPHFAAIAWLYREDYARAGYRVLPAIDPEAARMRLHVIAPTIALLAASLLPVLYRLAGIVYAAHAVALGLAFLACGCLFVLSKTKEKARLLLLASVIYLPSLFIVMMIDKVPVG